MFPWTKLEQLRHEKGITGFYISGHPLDDYKLEIENFCTVSVGEIRADLKNFKGKDFAFAGIITEANHKVGKNGKPYGSFTMEDYFDSIQLTLFSEEYMKQRHFLLPGTYVFIKARVEARFDAPDQLNVRVSSISLLSEVFDKFAKSVTVNLLLADINPDLIGKIRDLAKIHKGKSILRFQIMDEEEKMVVELPSRKSRVELKEFVIALEKLEILKYKIG